MLLDFVSSLQYLERIYRKQVKTIISWSVCLLGLVFIWNWNWQLLLATLVGSGLMILVYWLQSKSWLAYWYGWKSFFTHANRRLIVAVSSGSFAALSIYVAACILSESENQWLATGIIIQILISIVTLVLLGWYFLGGNPLIQAEREYNRLLSDLTHQDTLRQTIAIRQLTRLVQNSNLTPDYHSQLVEYYCLMLAQVRESIVKEVLLDSLENLGIENIINRQHQPLQIPIQFQASPKPMYRSPSNK